MLEENIMGQSDQGQIPQLNTIMGRRIGVILMTIMGIHSIKVMMNHLLILYINPWQIMIRTLMRMIESLCHILSRPLVMTKECPVIWTS